MTYVPAEHRQNTGYIFLVKYICIFSKNSVHSKSIQLKSLLIYFWPSNLKADHFHNINFLALLKFGKHKTTNQTPFSHFPCYLSYGCTVRHLPGKNMKVWGTRPISQPCLEHSVFASVLVVSWIVIIICSLVLQVSIRVHRTHNSAIYKST
jgi:hypothetical protein